MDSTLPQQPMPFVLGPGVVSLSRTAAMWTVLCRSSSCHSCWGGQQGQYLQLRLLNHTGTRLAGKQVRATTPASDHASASQPRSFLLMPDNLSSHRALSLFKKGKAHTSR